MDVRKTEEEKKKKRGRRETKMKGGRMSVDKEQADGGRSDTRRERRLDGNESRSVRDEDPGPLGWPKAD